MKLLTHFFMMVSSLILSNVTLAHTVSIASSVLLPGTRVVAGDLSKNEFFIIAEKTTPPVKKTLDKPLQIAVAKSPVPTLKVVLDRVFSPAGNKNATAHVNTVMNKPAHKVSLHQVENKKKGVKVSVASSHTAMHKVAVKKMIHYSSTLPHAVHRVTHKGSTTKAKLALHRTRQVTG